MSMPDSEQMVSRRQVEEAYDRLAGALQPRIDTEDCILVGVMVGGMIPLVNIAARLTGDFQIDYCHATRYAGELHGGAPRWIQRPRLSLAGRTVVLVDDIFDEGHTLVFIRDDCLAAGAGTVLSAVLVRKVHDRAVAGFSPDFTGLSVEDRYLFGCGMDYRERWRHLPEIYGVLNAESETS